MTLQQKLLAKKSKKGFTLVELVVVIAILAILAAIAIPAVIGIINSASESSGESDAASIDNACKTFHAGVVGGSINASSCTVAGVGTLPAKDASNSSKKSTADGLTVENAMKYDGIYDRLQSKIGDFKYDSGTIYYGETHSAGTTLSLTDTLGTVLAQ